MKKFIFFIMISTILTSSCNSNTKNVRGQITEGYIEVTGVKFGIKLLVQIRGGHLFSLFTVDLVHLMTI